MSVAVHPAEARTGRAHGWRWLAALAVAAGLLAAQGSRRLPAPANDGTAFSQTIPQVNPAETSAQSRRFKLATFNIHGGRGTDGRRDLGRIAECLAGADFVGLNEVHGARWFGGTDQAETLGRELQTAWLFAPTERRWWHDDFGNGALSRLPVRSWQTIPLAQRYDKSCRNAVFVVVEIAGRPLHVLLTHIDRTPAERQAQLRSVVDLYLSLATPSALLGDLNTSADDPQLKRLLATAGVDDPLTGLDAPGRIDWIVTRGLHSLARGRHEIGPSDHPQYWVECEMVDSK